METTAQTWIAIAIVCTAGLYLGRAAWGTLRASADRQSPASACGSGCGGCSSRLGISAKPLVKLESLEHPEASER